METLLTKEILDLMEKIGDPLVDPRVDDRTKDAAKKQELRKIIDGTRTAGLSYLFEDNGLTVNSGDYGLEDFFKDPDTLPDPDLVETACDLFKRYGAEIAAALLLGALPEAYAAGEGARVLLQRSQLAAGGAVSTRRILATAQFVIWVLTPSPPGAPMSDDMSKYTYQSFDDTCALWKPPGGQALCASLALRIMHALIRRSRPTTPGKRVLHKPADDVPLNQTDLLATLLSFSITVFEVLEQFGIYWTAEEQEAYFYVWNRVGETLGIGDKSVIRALTGIEDLANLKKALRRFDEGEPEPLDGVSVVNEMPTPGSQVTSDDRNALLEGRLNRLALRRVADAGTLRPQSVPEARALLARLRERMWALKEDSFPQREEFNYENFNEILLDVSPGRILLKAMVDELAARLPASQKTWPIAVIRQLVPPQVQDRLALGGTSPVGFVGGIVGTPRDLPGSPVLRRVSAEVLRQRATRVSNSLFLHYYDHGQLQIPGLLSTAVGYGLHWQDDSVSARKDGLY
jgi:hypothetical protein